MSMMVKIDPASMAPGNTTRDFVWGAPRLVHPTNYVSEAISIADPTKIDTAWLTGRPLWAFDAGDRVICGAHEVNIHREMVRYHNALGVTRLNPNDIHGVPSSGPLTPICDDTVLLMRRDPTAVRALFAGAELMVPVIVSPGTVTLAHEHRLISETHVLATDMANNKKYLPEGARKFGFLSPPTRKPNNLAQAEKHFKELMTIANRAPDVFEAKIWVKLCRSSGGEGVRSFTNLPDFLDWLASPAGQGFSASMQSQAFNEGIVLQIGVRKRENTAYNALPNFNFLVGRTPAQDRVLGGSYQAIENGSIHVGNEGDLIESDEEKITAAATGVANWLRHIGFRGVCGIDVIMGADGQVWVIDVNARWNASTSTVMKFNDLRSLPGVKYFRFSGKIRVPAKLSVSDYVNHLDAQGIGYAPDRGGVIPINFMTAHSGSANPVIAVAIFGPTPEAVSTYFNLSHMRQA